MPTDKHKYVFVNARYFDGTWDEGPWGVTVNPDLLVALFGEELYKKSLVSKNHVKCIDLLIASSDAMLNRTIVVRQHGAQITATGNNIVVTVPREEYDNLHTVLGEYTFVHIVEPGS
jgi:hypothetical protein